MTTHNVTQNLLFLNYIIRYEYALTEYSNFYWYIRRDKSVTKLAGTNRFHYRAIHFFFFSSFFCSCSKDKPVQKPKKKNPAKKI